MIALESKSERKDSIEDKKASLYFEESSKISKPSIRFMKKKQKTEIILKSLNGKKKLYNSVEAVIIKFIPIILDP